MLCYLADISSMCRLASWQAETTGALGMLSVQEISFILINASNQRRDGPRCCEARIVPSLCVSILVFSEVHTYQYGCSEACLLRVKLIYVAVSCLAKQNVDFEVE